MMLFAFVSNADNYFTIGDTLRIKPSLLGGYFTTDASAHIDGKMDNFSIVISYPDGFRPRPWHGIEGGEDLTIAYMDVTGTEQTYTASLTISHDYGEVSAYIPVIGYWDYNMDGILEPYGTAKWNAGDYAQMFTFNMFIDESFRRGWLTFDGHLDSGNDKRGAILADVAFYTRTWVWIGYKKGDVSGNERADIGDITMLIDYTLGKDIQLDEFQTEAADVNNDGIVDIDDVTMLIDMVLGR